MLLISLLENVESIIFCRFATLKIAYEGHVEIWQIYIFDLFVLILRIVKCSSQKWTFVYAVFIARRYARAVYATAQCPSVCPSLVY